MTEDKKIIHLDSTPPEGVKTPTSVGTMEATVENNPQELKVIRPYSNMIDSVPTNISPEAQIVIHALLSCFDRKKSVEEGVVKDLTFGFEACGIPQECTAKGLLDLYKEGWVRFEGPDGTRIAEVGDSFDDCWIRYEDKLLKMVYSE